jgi:hypothetical protein
MSQLKIIRPGIEWGPAHEEAEPISILRGKECVAEIFLNEYYEVVVVVPKDSTISSRDDGAFKITIPNDS